ncbi:MAG: FGGY-family carbohydrate kinase [Pseudomonadota bacterium]
MSLRLGIDIGTSGVRSAVIDAEGAVLSSARATHLPQGDTIDARKWWAAVEQCLIAQMAALNETGRRSEEITDIAVDGTSGSMVLTDAALEPVSPALMYNSAGFEAEAEEIARLSPPDHITRGSNSALARALRLLKLAEATPAHLMHQADFIAAKLLGRGGMSDFNNTLKTGFDPESEAWPDWSPALIAPALLPAPQKMGAAFGAVASDIAAAFGLSPGALVYPGTTDSVAAFMAAAPLEAGVAVTSLGSTLAVKLVSQARVDDPSIGLYSHRVGDVWLAGGASNTGGAVLAHFFSSEEIARLSLEIDPTAPSPYDYYPLLQPGERFPVNDPKKAPVMDPRPSDDVGFLKALFEGMAGIEALSYRAIKARGGDAPRRLFTAGGGARNVTWRRMRERRLGFLFSDAPLTEAAAGVARLAMPA